MSKVKTKVKITLKFIALATIAGIAVLVFYYILFLALYQERIFPGIKVSGINIGSQSKTSANTILEQKFNDRLKKPLTLTYPPLEKDDNQAQTFTLDLNEAQPEANFKEKVDQAFRIGRDKIFPLNLLDQFKSAFYGTDFTPKVMYRKSFLLNSQLSAIKRSVKKDPVGARVIAGETVAITPSEPGQDLDERSLITQLENYLNLTSGPPETIPLIEKQPRVTSMVAEKYKNVLESVKSSPLELKYNKQSWKIDQPALFSLLDFNETENLTQSSVIDFPQTATPKPFLDDIKLSAYLKTIAKEIDQPVKDARFTFDPGAKKVSEFQPAQEGRELDKSQTALLLTQSLSQPPQNPINLPVKVVKPEIGTSEVNNLGIKELLGTGISNFSGSIENRIFNVKLAASRINGTLVAPGETFSFNKAVGDVSGATGYKQAYVIKEGRTVLDDGGGVCQVSTTLFRAVLNSGLPVMDRTAHAYRVGYYEQGFPPGLDATVFFPSVDFKFKNDTQNHILIQTSSYGTGLTFNIYGTSDGRVASLTTPKISSQTPPPPELRQDDPGLPKGTVKQVDWSAWGANVSFGRTVTRNGETLISETWRSNYRPWQAVFLVGTKE